MKRTNRLSRHAIKEALDNLPSGVCFFAKNGMPVLCNRAMHRLAFALTGRDLQSLAELQGALQALPQTAAATRDEDTFLLSDGSAWRFALSQVTDQDGISYTQAIASDVTGLYRASKELARNNQMLAKMARHLKHATENVAAIMREEEILSMKMRIHHQVGSSVLNTRSYYNSGCPAEQKSDLIGHWNRTIRLLRNEIGEDDETDVYGELLNIASSMGVTIAQTGKLPEDPASAYLIIAAIRECLTNAIRHGESSKLFVCVRQACDTVSAVITNNGKAPAEKVTEGGGLSSLRARIEKAGGSMQVQSLPEFALTVCVPLRGEVS